MTYDVLIVGAGLAGLSCARSLQEKGINYLILEGSDRVGGRVSTDTLGGFRLDRGFQVFLTSYPEAKRYLDYEALQLKSFLPGACIRYGGKFYELTDPWRRPLSSVRSLGSPIGTLADKFRVGLFRSRCLRGTLEEHFGLPETTTLEALQRAGFSSAMIDRFFRPFLGGIFLDPELRTSSRMLDFVFRMFSLGDACLPSEGMEAIPRQLAQRLQPGRIQLDHRVARVRPGAVTLETGRELNAKSIVIATEGPAAGELLGDPSWSSGRGTICIYFSAPKAPIKKAILVLNGEGQGPINNLAVPTVACPSYGPKGKSLVSVTVLRESSDNVQLLKEVLIQLHQWFGDIVHSWEHLKTYSIAYALPAQAPPALSVPERAACWKPGIYVCGDHRDNASIQGAMVSGRRAAEAVLAARER